MDFKVREPTGLLLTGLKIHQDRNIVKQCACVFVHLGLKNITMGYVVVNADLDDMDN
jgi:hypothetical protein